MIYHHSETLLTLLSDYALTSIHVQMVFAYNAYHGVRTVKMQRWFSRVLHNNVEYFSFKSEQCSSRMLKNNRKLPRIHNTWNMCTIPTRIPTPSHLLTTNIRHITVTLLRIHIRTFCNYHHDHWDFKNKNDNPFMQLSPTAFLI